MRSTGCGARARVVRRALERRRHPAVSAVCAAPGFRRCSARTATSPHPPPRRRVPAVCRCETLDLTANELAKDHARHLAGGRVTIEHERLYRFEFPERPGALSRFLDALNGGWNVSLFHYRNHGGDVGRVLAALQVPEADSDAFDTFLTELEYPYVRECGNVAYKRFLQAS